MSSPTRTPAPSRRGRGDGRPGALARAASDARVAWAVAMVLAAALGIASVVFAPLAIAERDRSDVASVAAAMAVRLTTFSPDDLEAWARGLEELATPEYAEEVATLVDDAVRERMASSGAVSRGHLGGVYVQEVDRPEASALAVVRQTTGDAAAGDGSETTVRMVMTLRHTSGTWLVDGVTLMPDA